jgi:anti-sigma factor RsiW
MTCAEFVDFLMSYLDGEIPAAQRKTFERHVADCPPCGIYLGQYRDAIRMGKLACGDDAAEALPEDVPEELVAAILSARNQT